MTDDNGGALLPHNCILEDRKNLSISGVESVGSFDEETIIILTGQGELTVKGEKLHITHLTLEVGELNIEGKIQSLSYTDIVQRGGGFFSRVLR